MIEVSNLSYRYPQAKTDAVCALQFNIQPGEIFGFLGPSGAGKSTTQKVLIGLLKGYRGEIKVLGKDLSAWNADLYEHIGVSFEFPNHFLKLTALENLVYFSRLYSQGTHDPLDILRQVGLAEDANQRVETYSKGMRNRLTVARALLHDPKILFLDEPTSGLDPLNALLIKDIIRKQKNEGKTIFLTTHNMQVAEELCDRVALIVDGEIALIDAPESLRRQYGQACVRVAVGDDQNRWVEEFALDGLGTNNQFLALIRTPCLRSIHTQEASLEDVFIQVTGKRLL